MSGEYSILNNFKIFGTLSNRYGIPVILCQICHKTFLYYILPGRRDRPSYRDQIGTQGVLQSIVKSIDHVVLGTLSFLVLIEYRSGHYSGPHKSVSCHTLRCDILHVCPKPLIKSERYFTRVTKNKA